MCRDDKNRTCIYALWEHRLKPLDDIPIRRVFHFYQEETLVQNKLVLVKNPDFHETNTTTGAVLDYRFLDYL